MTPNTEREPSAYTIEEVAHLTRLSARTVRRAISSGKLQVVRVGRAVRVPRESLNALLSPVPLQMEVTPEDHDGR
jgi:excisionase family DNA binding protein